jgi:hypothetical protein
LAAPTVLGVIDTYGIELIHPIREGRVMYPVAADKYRRLTHQPF